MPDYSNVTLTDETQMKASATFKEIYAAITTVANGGLLNMHLMKRLFENALCENARASIIALMGSQRLFPSEVLSLLLEKEVNAVFTVGALRQLKCSMVEAYTRIRRSYLR